MANQFCQLIVLLAAPQQAKRFLPVLALLTRADGCTVAYSVRRERSVEHLLQQAKSFLPARALITRAGGCTVADHIVRMRFAEHLLQQT